MTSRRGIVSKLGLLALTITVFLLAACDRTGGPGEEQTSCVSPDEIKSEIETVQKHFKKLLEQLQLRAAGTQIPIQLSSLPTETLQKNIFLQIDQRRKALACSFPPFAIDDDNDKALRDYPKRPSCVERGTQHLLDHVVLEVKLLKLSKFVGKFEITIPDKTPSDKRTSHTTTSYTTSDAIFWGTGFRIAPNVIATSCHAMESLLPPSSDGSGNLVLDDQIFDIHFRRYVNDSGGIVPERICTIKQSLGCSQKPGVDVTLLLIDSCQDLKGNPVQDDGFYGEPTPLYKDDPNALGWLAVIGYGDPGHSIDPDTDDLFRPYFDNHYEKFLSIDRKIAVEDCDLQQHSHEVILDAADTTVGESGGIVEAWTLIDQRRKKEREKQEEEIIIDPVVAGMHSCCATFFSNQRGEPPSEYVNCAKVHRTFDNQAISTWDILHDQQLCKIISDYHGLPGYNCP